MGPGLCRQKAAPHMHWVLDTDLVGLDSTLPALVPREWLLLRFLHASHPDSVFLQGMERFSCVPGQGRRCALMGDVLWGDPQLEAGRLLPAGLLCAAGWEQWVPLPRAVLPLEINDGANNTLLTLSFSLASTLPAASPCVEGGSAVLGCCRAARC